MDDPIEPDGWTRRRDLEGGKELCIWLSDTSDAELYVESHRYRGSDYNVYTTDAEDNWEHIGEYTEVTEAIDAALAWARENTEA